MHDPAKARERRDARHRGGVNRRVAKHSAAPLKVTIETGKDVVKVLQAAINDALRLENSHARARTLGYLCDKAMRALELGEISARVEALERMLSEDEDGNGEGSDGM